MHRTAMHEWDDARFFLAVQRFHTLSAAARALGVNQSTVGRRITALEESLGARVFFRAADKYELTPEGERMLPRAERIEDEVTAIARELAGREVRLTGSVRLTAPDGFSVRIISPALPALSLKYPEMEIELVADNRLLSLSKREADMAIRVGRPRDVSLVARRICGFAHAVYASREYLARRGPFGDGTGHDFLAAENDNSNEREWFAQLMRRGRNIFRTNSTLSQVTCASAGMGAILLPCYLGDTEANLVRVVEPSAEIIRDVWLVMHHDLQNSARVRATADHLVTAVCAHAELLEGRRPKSVSPRPAKSVSPRRASRSASTDAASRPYKSGAADRSSSSGPPSSPSSGRSNRGGDRARRAR
jgi:DNA-binding transcriptional LysR family regulator